MFATKRGVEALAARYLSVLMLCVALAGGSAACRADNGIADVNALPKLAGAINETNRALSQMAVYSAPGLVDTNVAVTRKLLTDDGWTQYVDPLAEGNGDGLLFKRAGQGLIVSFRKAGKNMERSRVTYAATRINVDLPLPDTASDVMFSGNRPYLRCATLRIVETTRDDLMNKLSASGWSSLTVADIGERWPGAKPEQAPEGGARAFFVNAGLAYQKPIMMTLRSRGDGTSVEIKVAPFALPRELEAGPENYGLPAPQPVSHAAYFDGAARRELKATLAAELGPVLAFYRRELPRRGWVEKQGAVVKPESALLTFKSPDGPAALKLTRINNETAVSLTQKNPGAAAKAGILPKPGQVRLMLGNMGDVEASVTIDGKTTKVAPGVGSPKAPSGPTFELAPGNYKVAVKVAGRPDRSSVLSVAADDSWGLMVTPAGVLPLQIY
jgi:hypothetical protein